MISAWGVPVAGEALVTSADEAAEAADAMGYPVVMKGVSPDILHKTEAGIIRLGVASAEEAREAFEGITKAAQDYDAKAELHGVAVQEMVVGGVETIVGINDDPQLGPILLFGMGGVMVEIYNDVALRVCPIMESEAREMIAEVKGARLLEGFRGQPAADVKALAETLVSVSHLAVQLDGKLSELDINPLLVLPEGQGVKAVDALVLLNT